MKSIVPALREYISAVDIDPDVDKIVLFGSHARGEARITSDIDLAIISTSELSVAQRGVLICALSDFEPLCEYDFFFTLKESLQTTNYFDANYHIQREGVVLYDSSV